MASKDRSVGVKTVVPSDGNDTNIAYPTGTSIESPFIGYKVELSNGAFQDAPITGLFFYSNQSYFQIHAWGIDLHYVGKSIWVYFIADK